MKPREILRFRRTKKGEKEERLRKSYPEEEEREREGKKEERRQREGKSSRGQEKEGERQILLRGETEMTDSERHKHLEGMKEKGGGRKR